MFVCNFIGLCWLRGGARTLDWGWVGARFWPRLTIIQGDNPQGGEDVLRPVHFCVNNGMKWAFWAGEGAEVSSNHATQRSKKYSSVVAQILR